MSSTSLLGVLTDMTCTRCVSSSSYYSFFFNDTATTEIYTLSLHDALPISKDISNVVTDAASGVVDIFHGIDKAVADTWNNFWKDGKADGIGSNLSRK